MATLPKQISLFTEDSLMFSPGDFPVSHSVSLENGGGGTDERFLWPEFVRAIDEIKPAWVVGENVAGIISMESSVSEIKMETEEEICYQVSMVLQEIKQDLQKIGYESKFFVIPACAIGAFHKRDRIWIIANSDKELRTSLPAKPEVGIVGKNGKEKPSDWSLFYSLNSRDGKIILPEGMQCQVFRNDDGVPEALDEFAAYGNAINPHVVFEIFRIIELTV